MVEFQKTPEGIKLLAIYLAQLSREGIAYQVDAHGVRHDRYNVKITGY